MTKLLLIARKRLNYLMTTFWINVSPSSMVAPYLVLFKFHAQILILAITQKSILDIIKSLNVNKAHGPDNISGRMVELCGDKITLPLSIIFENVINTGIFPTLWKSGNVTPVHKKDSKRIINNYRPLLAKIFEKILFFENV